MTTNYHLSTVQLQSGNEIDVTTNSRIEPVNHNSTFSELCNAPKQQSNIGMFGLGCVGKGVMELIGDIQDVESANVLKSIVVKHEYKSRKFGYDIVGTSVSHATHNRDINTIVEVINDDKQAFRIAQLSQNQNKHFISANKKMIAENLNQIVAWNKSSQLAFLYEAAVAGSIPIIRNLDIYFENKDTQSIKGIINGTSNYILSQIFKHNCLYNDALEKAQELGFAEKDPKADVGGYDAKYKAVILALHAFGCVVEPEKVLNLGIQKIAVTDIAFAQSKNLSIKLVANIERTDLGLSVSVLPQFIANDSELAKTDNEDNLIIVNNNQTNFYFKGAGAGGIATGTAILSDLKASRDNYKYTYNINNELHLDNENLIQLYISKNGSNKHLEIKGNHIKETIDYKIVVTSISRLKELDLDGVFIAQI